MRKAIEINCSLCGAIIIRDKYYYTAQKKWKPNYGPLCSKCSGQKSLKKKGTCSILKQHHNKVRDDPEHMSTEQIVSIMCDTTPSIGMRRGNPSKNKTAVHHKGYCSHDNWNRLNTLVKQGKAKWWRPYRDSVEDAIKAAGI
jgi:hypothetical protein